MKESTLSEKNLRKNNGNYQLIHHLQQMGITQYSGVNGGGVIHITKYLTPNNPLEEANSSIPKFLTLAEYTSGFMPLGYYLASGKIAGAISTTGAAIKLSSCGLSDAKFHNIPALYLVALNSLTSIGKSPLQDVSVHGMNIVPQLTAELGKGCIIIDNIKKLSSELTRAYAMLQHHHPVVIAFHPDVLSETVSTERQVTYSKQQPSAAANIDFFISDLLKTHKNKRIILYVGEEAAAYPDIQNLTTQLAIKLHAPTVWSVNGANAVSPANPYSYGYILFGGNDASVNLWKSLSEEDIVITIGFCAGEYSLNLEPIRAGHVWHIGNYEEPFGQISRGFHHRSGNYYHYLKGDISLTLKKIILALEELSIESDRPPTIQLDHFNSRKINQNVQHDCVDMISFYQNLQSLWQPDSIGFDDVCTAYKDRQYVTERPHPFIKFWALHHGSAMGGAFGLGIGAKLACPQQHIFIFSGDGCWRLFGGAIADVANLGLRLFILNNGTYALIEKGIEIIMPDLAKERTHSRIANIDFVSAAKANGWLGYTLKPNLSNLKDIMEACYSRSYANQSILIEVPIDGDQVVGLNSRLMNLSETFYL